MHVYKVGESDGGGQAAWVVLDWIVAIEVRSYSYPDNVPRAQTFAVPFHGNAVEVGYFYGDDATARAEARAAEIVQVMESVPLVVDRVERA